MVEPGPTIAAHTAPAQFGVERVEYVRVYRAPSWVMEILKVRLAESESEWILPNTIGKLRDPDNARKQLRTVVECSKWEGLHPHAFRHLVTTRLDAAGWSARDIADYLGHEKPSMTQDVYMARKVVGGKAGNALGDLRPESSDERRG